MSAAHDSEQAAKETPAEPLAARGRAGGFLVALLALVADQAVKLYLIYPFDLGARGFFRVTSFLDLVLVWNTGISYGLFPQEGTVGRTLLLAFKVAALAVLAAWLWRTRSALTAASLGLIIGGAIGNAVDRVVFGAVADFVFFHLDALNFRWYVFNLADVAIVAGVIGILYESLRGERAAKAP